MKQQESQEQQRSQASVCPQTPSQIYPRSGEQKISLTIRALCKVLCKEALRRCHTQTQILHPVGLEGEAEAEVEVVHDVEEAKHHQRQVRDPV